MGNMHRFIQIFGSVLAMAAVLAAGSLIYPIPHVSEFVKKYVTPSYTVSMVTAVILGLLILVVSFKLLYAVFAPAKSDKLVITSEQGAIVIDKNVIKSAVYDAIQHLANVENPEVEVKLGKQPEHTKIVVGFQILDGHEATSAGNNVQISVRNGVETLLGSQIADVVVNVEQVKLAEVQQEKRESARPRVR